MLSLMAMRAPLELDLPFRRVVALGDRLDGLRRVPDRLLETLQEGAGSLDRLGFSAANFGLTMTALP